MNSLFLNPNTLGTTNFISNPPTPLAIDTSANANTSFCNVPIDHTAGSSSSLIASSGYK